MISWVLFVFTLMQSIVTADLHPKVLHYQPEIVRLTGIIEKQTFPGPPSYESIPAGDGVERHWYLRLDRAIHVVPVDPEKATDLTGPEEKNVKILQMAISEQPSIWVKLKKARTGSRVNVVGTLFHATSAHNHSRVLISVDALEVVENK